MKTLLTAVFMACVLTGCVFQTDGACPCGASSDALIEEHDLNFPEVHVVSEKVECKDVACRPE